MVGGMVPPGHHHSETGVPVEADPPLQFVHPLLREHFQPLDTAGGVTPHHRVNHGV